MTDASIEVTYEFPGILVVNHAHGGGDLGIDTDTGQGPGYRVVVYEGTWADGAALGVSLADFNLLTVSDPPAELIRGHPSYMGSALTQVRAQVIGEGFYFRLPVRQHEAEGRPCVLVTRGHVFGYWDDDGGACTAIVHRLPDGGGECSSLGCDPTLVRGRY